MRVTIQFQEPRKPYAWVNAFKANVLFADKKIVLLRGAGSHSVFETSGQWRSVGYSSFGAIAKKIPKRRVKNWRIDPDSLKLLKASAK